jgi:hypothetical protein
MYTGMGSVFSAFSRNRKKKTWMYMYTGFCIRSIFWKPTEENIDVHVYWVLYSQQFLETERRNHRCTCILGSVFSVFSGNRMKT